MPRYVTEQHIIRRYGESFHVTNSDRDVDQSPDGSAVLDAIRDAEAEVDSYVGQAYDLPLPGCNDPDDPANNTVPPALERVSVDIAVYRLASESDVLTEEKRQRYEDAIAWLTMLAKKEVSLGLPDPAPLVGGSVVQYSAERVLTREGMKGIF